MRKSFWKSPSCVVQNLGFFFFFFRCQDKIDTAINTRRKRGSHSTPIPESTPLPFQIGASPVVKKAQNLQGKGIETIQYPLGIRRIGNYRVNVKARSIGKVQSLDTEGNSHTLVLRDWPCRGRIVLSQEAWREVWALPLSLWPWKGHSLSEPWFPNL